MRISAVEAFRPVNTGSWRNLMEEDGVFDEAAISPVAPGLVRRICGRRYALHRPSGLQQERERRQVVPATRMH